MRGAQPGAEADAIASLVESLAVLLDAGLTPRSAWEVAAGHRGHPVADRVAIALRQHRSSAEALLSCADTDDLRRIAAAWRVAEEAGAPLGPALRTVGETLRDVAEAEREADVALSGPRATARLVSWLPVAGVGMAAMMGADLVGAATSVIGAAAIGLGALLLAGGRWWMRALVRRAVARRPAAGFPESLVTIALAGGSSADAAQAMATAAARTAGLVGQDDTRVREVLGLATSAGAPAAELLAAAARQERRTARAEGRRAATTLGVKLMVPLGVCVLPSFLLLAVVPVILSLLSSTTAGWR